MKKKVRQELHELPLTNRILDIALEHAEKNRAKSIKSVQIGIGSLHEAEPEWLNRYFSWISRGTAAENALLEFKRYPVVWVCGICENSFSQNIRSKERLYCPKCSETKELRLFSGNEFRVESIIISDKD